MIARSVKIISARIYRNLLISGLLIILTASLSIAQEKDRFDYFDPETWLLGDFNYNSLLNAPHDRWFSKEFNNYELDDEAFMEIEAAGIDSIEILVVLGTWCSDSRREVPRFMKIIETLGYDRERIRFIGVDSYKEAPVPSYGSMDIERVPTFIFYKNNFELGRIIEYPEASLERDMLRILTMK